VETEGVPVALIPPTGKPVAFVSVTEVGVPNTGVTKVGEVDKTLLPEPVEVVTPVPPLATAKVPAKVTAPVVAVEGVKPVVPAEKEVTPPAVPLEAAVILPCASTVKLVLVYEPAVTAVLASATVPDVVIVPPDKPVPAVIDVTVPVVLDLLLNVVQSVLVRYPLTDVVAAGIDIAGVVPPLETTGLVPVTEVTAVPQDVAVPLVVKNLPEFPV
jgi:hypothetical protein